MTPHPANNVYSCYRDRYPRRVTRRAVALALALTGVLLIFCAIPDSTMVSAGLVLVGLGVVFGEIPEAR